MKDMYADRREYIVLFKKLSELGQIKCFMVFDTFVHVQVHQKRLSVPIAAHVSHYSAPIVGNVTTTVNHTLTKQHIKMCRFTSLCIYIYFLEL